MAIQSTLAGRYRHRLAGPLSQLLVLLRYTNQETAESRIRVGRLISRHRVLLIFLMVLSWVGWRNVQLRAPSRSADADDRPTASVGANGTRELWVPYKGRLRQVLVHPTKQSTFEAHKRLFLGSPIKDPETAKSAGQKRRRASGQFLHELRALLSIMIPRLGTRVVGFLALEVMLLSLRTYLSLVVANLDGRIVRDLIAADGKGFTRGVCQWLLLAVPASYTNAMIHYLQGKVSLEFRTRLIRYIHDLYLGPALEYYKVSNIDGEIEGADHYITSDLNRFCDRSAALFSNLGKPAVDMFFFAYQLSRNLGPVALAGIFINYGFTAWLLRQIAPPFGKLAARETSLEGEYRNAQSRLITNAEEIAFYDGASIERKTLMVTFGKLTAHTSKLLKIKAFYNMAEDFVLKYSWSASGFLFAAIPVFLPTWSGSNHEQVSNHSDRERARMGDFITNKRIMLSMADAGGRLMYSIKDLAELAGYTQRIYSLIQTLHRVKANSYKELAVEEFGGEIPELSLADVHGTVQKGFTGLRLEDTPVVVPGLGYDLSPGEELIRDISFRVNPGDHLLITGANGVGKTSIARMAAGLWPTYRGLLSEPAQENITFLPQRPYFSCGSLRDQITYPTTHSEMLEGGRTDEELLEILRLVKLDYLPGREGGMQANKEWKDVLSGGEKQRMLFARVLFAKPKFAVVDEGTSAVSQDVEGQLYENCKKFGITLITISHRISLLRYHTCLLEVGLGDKSSEWRFERTNTSEGRLSVKEEIKTIKDRLAKIPELEKRRKEVGKLLGLPESTSRPIKT